MRWRLVDKRNTTPPTSGQYPDWKPILAEEGGHQCVYCAISERSFGGLRNFHVEHFRPKKLFPALKNEISNLFFACAICNTFKGDDWPAEPYVDHATPWYHDPSRTDYSSVFSVCGDYSVAGDGTPARYMVEKLFLNRPQLLLERREHDLCGRADAASKRVLAAMTEIALLPESRNASAGGLVTRAAAALRLHLDGMRRLTTALPYAQSDTERS